MSSFSPFSFLTFLFIAFFLDSDNDGNSIKSHATYCNILCSSDPTHPKGDGNLPNKNGKKEKYRKNKQKINTTENENNNSNNIENENENENEEKDNHGHIVLINSRSISPLHSKSSDESML